MTSLPPLTAVVVAWLLGIVAASHLRLPVWAWGALALVALLGAGAYRRHAWRRIHPAEIVFRVHPLHDKRLLVLLLLAAWAGGGARTAWATPTFDSAALARYNDLGARVGVEGWVAAYPERDGTRQRLRLHAEAITLPDGRRAPVQGDFIVSLGRYPAYHYGDRLLVRGLLETPPTFDDFDYRAYLARKGVYSLMRRASATLLEQGRGRLFYRLLYALRDRASATLNAITPEPHAALLNGILLGIESGIPDDLMEAFNRTGTTHIIVISGFNISIIAGLFLALGKRLVGERRATWLAVGGVALYALLVGADAAVSRAALMGILYVVALHMGRRSLALNSLAASALVMTLLNPFTLYDLGFQLSALATLALILFVPTLTAWVEARLAWLGSRRATVMALLNDALIVTFAAQLLTTPLIVSVFGRLSIVSLLTNLLILPVQSWVMLGGGAALLAGLVWLPLGRALAWIPWLGLTWTFAMVEWTARLPLASVDVGRFGTRSLLGYYVGLALVWGYATQPTWRERARTLWRTSIARWQTVGLAALVVFATLPWLAAQHAPDGRLHLYALDVGQGDALLIITPDGKQLLVDGGNDPQLLLARVGRRLPPWDRTLDALILTHADADHLGGLPGLLERYDVAMVIHPGLADTTALWDAWETALAQEQTRLVEARRGQRLMLGDGVRLDVLGPPRPYVQSERVENDNSVVVRLRYGAFCALLAGDIEAPAEAELVRSGILTPCAVLKVAHHGSASSTTRPFLDAVRPRFALLSVGADNRYGHPNDAVLDRLQQAGVRVWRTDHDGTLHLATDGRTLWFEAER